SSTSVIAQAATIGFVIDPTRQIVSAAIGVLEPAPSKARLPTASTWTSPWRATTASAPGAKPGATHPASTARTRANPFDHSPPGGPPSPSHPRLSVYPIREDP